MPTQVYHARLGMTLEDGAVPKESRFGGSYGRAGLAMDNALFTFVWLQPGWTPVVPPTHRHPYDQLVFVVSGRLQMFIGNQPIDDEVERDYELVAGDALYVPRNVTHSGRALGDEAVFALEAFAPMRTDYLYLCEHQLTFNVPERQPDGSRVETRPYGHLPHERAEAIRR